MQTRVRVCCAGRAHVCIARAFAAGRALQSPGPNPSMSFCVKCGSKKTAAGATSQPVCLQCNGGGPEQSTDDDASLLNDLYPGPTSPYDPAPPPPADAAAARSNRPRAQQRQQPQRAQQRQQQPPRPQPAAADLLLQALTTNLMCHHCKSAPAQTKCNGPFDLGCVSVRPLQTCSARLCHGCAANFDCERPVNGGTMHYEGKMCPRCAVPFRQNQAFQRKVQIGICIPVLLMMVIVIIVGVSSST